MKKRFYIAVTILVGIITAIIFSLSQSRFYKDAAKLTSDGDTYMQQGYYTGALDFYKKAEEKWPLYKIDPRFQQKKSKTIEEVKKKVAVTIFLKDEATDPESQSLIEGIKEIKGVREAKLISKEDSLKIYRERNKNELLLTEFVTKDIFPVAIEVFLNDLSIKNEVSKFAKSKTFVESVL